MNPQIAKRVQQITLYLVLIAIWEILVSYLKFGNRLLPSPSAIAFELADNFFSKYNIANSTIVTLQEVAYGFAAALIFGIAIAIALASSNTIRNLLGPLINAIQAVPKSALAPLLVLWFGFGLLSKVVLTFLLAFFPIIVNGLLGLTSVEPELLDLLRVMQTPKLKEFTKVRLPNSLPYFIAGIRIAIPLSVIGAVVGEFISAEVGLGWIILNATYTLNVNLLFAALAFLVFIAMLLNQFVGWAEPRLIPWHISERDRRR